LAALAARMNATWGEVLDAVLPHAANGIPRVYRGAVLTTAVNDAERDSISAATGISGADIDAMTLAGHYGSSLITVDDRTGRARTPWGLVYRQRFCPLCMKAFPGRRKLEWFLPWITTCIEHRCFLADTCPRCAQVQVASDWFRRNLYTHPDRCRRLIKAQPRPVRCLARLATSRIDTLRPRHPVLTMQEKLTELLAENIIEDGVYRVAPVSAVQLLIDVQVLGNWILRAPNLTDLITMFGGRAGEREISRWRRRLQTSEDADLTCTKVTATSGALRVGMAQPAAWVGTAVAAALTVLLQPSLEGAGKTLRAATRAAPTRERRYRPHIARQTHSAVVTAVDINARAAGFSVLDQLRYRTVTGLPCLPDTARHDSTHAMLHAVPTLFWPEWAFRLDTGKLAWPTARQVMSRLLLTIGCVMAIPQLEGRLRTTVRAQRVHQAADDLRAHPDWDAIITALLRLHEYLQAHPPPIDYQRRRAMNYEDLLPEAQWMDLVAEQGLRTSPATATAARLWFIEQLSGAPIRIKRDVPPCRGVCTDRMRTTLTPQLVDNLHAVAVEFLKAHDVVGEPPTWAPPLTLTEGLALPGTPPETIDPNVVHELVRSGWKIPAIAHHLDTSVWKVRHQLEHHPLGPVPQPRPTRPNRGHGPGTAQARVRDALPENTLRHLRERRGLTYTQIAESLELAYHPTYLRQLISQLATQYGIRRCGHDRLGEVITAEWQQQRHLIERRPPKDLAADVAITAETNSSRAPKLGIHTHNGRWHTPPDARVILLLNALSMNPEDMPEKMLRRQSWTRIQRFTAAARYDSVTHAAENLGCNPNSLCRSIRRLEADLGHPLVGRAGTRHHAMTLTRFGHRLAQAARRID
jgi:hypothetical protein